MTANGGTAMYDAVVEALPLAARGRNPKKALVVISDGNDTSSRALIREVKQRIRESEVLVYAIGLDSQETERRAAPQPPPRVPFPIPQPFPPRRPGRFPLNARVAPVRRRSISSGDDRVNVAALRDMTDDSGGRTEIVRDSPRSESRDRRHRRRVEQAVQPRLSVPGKEGRPVALDSRRAPAGRLPRPRATRIRGELEHAQD